MKIYVFIMGLLLCTLRVEAQTFPHQVQEPLDRAITMQQDSQQELDKWEAEKADLLNRYERLLLRKAQLRDENARMQEQIDILTQKIQVSKQAVTRARELGREVEPFLRTSMELLDAVVKQSLPFDMAERRARIEQLRRDLLDAESAAPEQFRRLFKTLSMEFDYGRSLAVQQIELEINGERVFMSQLRIGHLALFALSLDRQRCAFYDQVDEEWKWLDPRWCDELDKAIAMANKQRPVDILNLPFGSLAQ